MWQIRKKVVAMIVAVSIISAVGCGLAGAYLENMFASDVVSSNIQYQQLTTSETTADQSKELTIPEIAALTQGAVVEISTEQVKYDRMMGEYVSQGAGSGVIIKRNGYIVTNNHVIQNSSKIKVRLKNGEEYEGKLVGTDSTTDLAVIKIDKKDLPTVVMGDSSSLVVGELAVAIGNPLGELGGTVTEGIISATDREITIEGEKMTLLQTTAAINPGNSGGALLNSKAELVGIVNAKSSGSNIEGLGFAIPIDNAKDVINQLIEQGYVSGRVQLGVSLLDISNAQTAMSYMVNELGVYVVAVSYDNGLQIGDRIVSIDGTNVSTSGEVKEIIKSHEVGDNIKVKISRGGDVKTLTIKLTEKKK